MLKKLMGSLKRKHKPSDLSLKEVRASTGASIPISYDLRQLYPKSLSINNILNQGDCGSCWAFGTSESLSDRLYIASNGSIDVQLSPQILVSCDWEGNDGCNGGVPQLAWTYMEMSGLPTLECVPYSDGNGKSVPCAHECSNGDSFKKYYAKMLSDHTFEEVKTIQEGIMAEGSICGTMSVYSDFLNYQSGVYVTAANATYLGGHAIKILGWGFDQTSGLDYWIVANSWARSWGMNGYFWIQRGVDMDGIDSDASAAKAYVPGK